MPSKRMEWQIGFSADTKQLERQLDSVKERLQKISSLDFAKDNRFPLTEKIEQASLAAGDLLQRLNQATNIDTGRLDLSKFRKSLEDGGKSLQQYQKELATLGPVGQKAFLSVAESIANAEPPFRRLSALTEKMAVTLKNTIRWQVSTTALNTFVGALEAAYGYSKDLNESLNNIRIVTGKSVEQMSQFAEDANKAASRLSSTTLDYTNASLIFFQQGLSEEEVKRRTDVTLQLAEVTGESVETVSSQLTAIWNNFSDGSDDLARYADVLTHLGAVTASSSDEIATGLAKFSAVANTVGLSYDYAAAALATLTATTRESADIVGTSLRTIFARLESLKLGETLEDGVTLTKYSEALRTAGVEILDTSGKIKDMNTILDETMEAWGNLDKTQQTALATTVAGVRQYAQFIAFMENQDFFRENVKEAAQATGELKKQAEVYTESWEAARDRVKNAAQDVYDSLINEDFFIEFDNLAAGFLHTTADMLDGLGGMRGVLLALGGILTKVFQKQMAQGLRNAAFDLSLFTKQQQKANQEFKTASANVLANSQWSSAKDKGLAVQIGLNERINEINANISNEQQIQLRNLAQLVGVETEIAESAKERRDAELQAGQAIMRAVELRGSQHGNNVTTKAVDFDDSTFDFLSGENYATKSLTKNSTKTTSSMLQTFSQLSQQIGAMEQASLRLKNILGKDFEYTSNLTTEQKNMFAEVSNALSVLGIQFDETGEDYQELDEHIENAKVAQIEMYDVLVELLEGEGYSAEKAKEMLDSLVASMQAAGEYSNNFEGTSGFASKKTEDYLEILKNASKGTSDWADKTISAANCLFNLGQAITTTKDLLDQVKDGTITLAGALTGLGSVTMSFVQLAPAIKSVTTLLQTTFSLSAGAAGLVVAGIAAIIAAIGFLVNKTVKESQRAEEELKQAQERASKAKEAFTSAKQEYDNLVAGSEEYKNLETQLDHLTAGSKAFEEQLLKVNDAAEALIEKLPELKQYVTFDSAGNIVLGEGWERVVSEEKSKTDLAAFSAEILEQDALRKGNLNPQDNIKVEQIPLPMNTFSIFGSRVQELFSKGDFFNKEWDQLAEEVDKLVGYSVLGNFLAETRLKIQKYEEQAAKIDAQTAYSYNNLLNQQDLSTLTNNERLYATNAINPGAAPPSLKAIGEYYSLEEEDGYNKLKKKKIGKLGNEDLSARIIQYGAEQGIEIPESASLKSVLKSLGEEQSDKGWKNLLYKIYQEDVSQFTDTYIELGREYGEKLSSLGLGQNIQNALTEAVVGKRKDASGLSLSEIEYLQEHGQELIDTLGPILEDLGDTQGADYLKGFLTETMQMSIESARDQIKTSLKSYIHGLSDLYDQMSEGIEYEDLSDEAKQTYDELTKNYEGYLSKIEQMDEGSYAKRESLRDMFDLAFAEGLRQLSEVGASNIEILEEVFSDLGRTINSSFDTLEDYYNLMSIVPNDLTISFSELKDLWAQGHVDLLANAKITSGGLIELNKQTVTDYINGAKEKYKADLKQRINTLTVQRDILQTELDNYKKLSKADKLRYIAGIENNENLGAAFEELDKIGVGAAENLEQAFKESAVDGIGSMITAAQELQNVLNGDTVSSNWITRSAQLIKDIENPRSRFKRNSVDSSAISELKAKQEAAFNDLDARYQQFQKNQITEIDNVLNILQQAYDNEDVWNEYAENLGSSTEDAAKSQEKLLEALKETLERYHEINRELKNLEREYSNLDKLTERLYGKPHLDNLAQEEKSLKDQIELQKKKLLVVQANLNLDLKRVKELVPYGEIGSDGEIKNYTQILADAAKAYNDAIQDTNSMSDEDKEKYQETMDAIKQRYDDIKEALDQYEETLDEMHELEDQIIDNKYLLEDKKLESLTYKLQLILDIKENEDAINEFGKKLAESFGDYLTHGQNSLDFGANLEAANEALLPHLKAQWDELFAMYNEANDSASKAAIEQELANVRDQIYSTMEAMLDYVDVLENALPKALDAARERFDAMINQINHSKTIYDAVKQLTELQGLTEHTEEGFNRLQDLAKKTMEAEILNASMQRQWYENAYSRLMEAEAALERVEEGDESYDLLKNARDALLEEYNQAEEAMLESAVSALEQAREIFTSQIDKAKEDFSKALSHGLGLDFMMDKYDRYIDSEERYLDVVNEEYEVNKWYRKLQKQIDEAKSADAIARLKELQKEIDIRRANNTLSQYDLEILNAKYEMTLKQMALEEAQNSATNMRLQRDSQGNWNYVYTADYDSIQEAQQGFEDAANDYYNIAKQQVKDVTQEILDTWQECADRIAEIYEDETLTVEEREARIAELRQYYADKVKSLEEEKNVAIQDIYAAASEIAQYYESLYNQSLNNMGSSGDNFADRFADVSDRIGSSSEDMADRYDQSVNNMGDVSNNFTQSFAEDLQSMLGDMDGFLNSFTGNLGDMTSASSDFERLFNQYLNQASQAANEYQMNIQQVTNRTGISFDELQNHVQRATDTINRLNQATGNSYQQLGYTIGNVINSIWSKIPQIQQVTTQFQAQIQSIYGAVQAMQQWLATQSQQVWQPNYLYDYPIDVEQPTAPGHNLEETEDVDSYWPRYAKGGYTGPGHEAIPAILHGSEYVLNPEDTSKILSAAALMKNLNLDTLLSIMNSLKLSATMTRSNLAEAIVPINGINNSTTQSIQQQVVINADFPNVSDSNEIKAAFDNLVNRAIQYAELK